MSRQLQPSVPLVSLVKTEPPTVIKNESPEEAIEEEISTDIKDIDIVYHSLLEKLIKNETVPETILETKYSESVETQVLVKTEDTRDENVTRDQEVIEVQGSHEHSNTLSNPEIHKQLDLNTSKDLNGVGTSSRKAKYAKRTDFVQCYKTDRTTSWEKEKEKIKIIRACDILIESHEYTSLAKDKYVCNHCQQTYKTLKYLKVHIKRMHRKVTTMFQCPYCPYKSKWNQDNINRHIIQKHKNTKDIQWFQCHLCEKKFKLKSYLFQHMKIHLTHEQMQDLKRHLCGKCDYKTYASAALKRHELIHLKPEEIQYFYCYHCSYKSKEKGNLKHHIFRKHFKYVKQGKWHHCDKCDYKTYLSTNLKNHKLSHLKPEEIQYFYCYHCSYKTKHKGHLKAHIFIHFKREQVKFDCYICNFTTPKRESIIKHIKKHSKVQKKSEINEVF